MIISAQENSDYYDQAYAIQTTTDGAWVRYNNVNINKDNMGLTVRASNPTDAPGTITVYQVPQGAAAWTEADRIGVIEVPATKPADVPFARFVPYTSETGDSSNYAAGTDRAFVQVFTNVGTVTTSSAAVGGAGHDLVLVFSDARMGLKWFQAGDLVNMAPADIKLRTFHYASEIAGNNTAIVTVSAASTNTTFTRNHVYMPPVVSWASGTLALEVRVDGRVVAASAPRWEVTSGTGTVNSSGIYQAPATAGTSYSTVTVTFDLPGEETVQQSIVIENRGLTPVTGVQAIQIRTGNSVSTGAQAYGYGRNSNYGNISIYKGTLQVTAVTYPANQGTGRAVTFDEVIYADPDCTIPSSIAVWTAAASAGNVEGNPGTQGPGGLNPFNANELRGFNRVLQATGTGNGDVYIKATHEASGVTGVHKIIIGNQGKWDEELQAGVRDVFGGAGYARVEAEHYDSTNNANAAPNGLNIDNIHGNDAGLQVRNFRNGNWIRFMNLDFSNFEKQHRDVGVSLKYMKVLSDPATLTLRLDDPATGKIIGSWEVRGDNDIRMNWEETPISVIPKDEIAGVHDLYLVISWAAAPTGNPTFISSANVNSTTGSGFGTGLHLGVNWIGFENVHNDTSELKELVDLVDEYYWPKHKDFIKSTWKAVEIAQAAAKEALAYEGTTKEEIDEAFAALDAAVKALVKIAVAETTIYDFVSIVETSKNSRVWELTFNVTLTLAGDDGVVVGAEVMTFKIALNGNNANLDGIFKFDDEHELRGYSLAYDVKGNGSNIKQLTIFPS